MSERLTTALLRRAAKLAEQHKEMNHLIGALFEKRYGSTYSDVDCDPLIDTLDYGLGGLDLTLAECDRLMAKEGYPKLEQKP